MTTVFCVSQRLVEIKGSKKELLRQAGIPWQRPPIIGNWLQLQLLPLRVAWLLYAAGEAHSDRGCESGHSRVGGGAKRIPQVCTYHDSDFRIDCCPRDKQRRVLEYSLDK